MVKGARDMVETRIGGDAAKSRSRGNFGDFIIMYIRGEITDEDIREMKRRYRRKLALQAGTCDVVEDPPSPTT
jgi:hypothetical protein